MRKKIPILLPLCVLCLLLVWYLWPRSFSDTLPGFSKDDPVSHCAVLLTPSDPGSGLSTKQIELAADSQTYHQLMERLTSTRYLRNPGDLVRLGQASSTQSITLEDYTATLSFYQGEQGESMFSMSFYGSQVATQGGSDTRSYFPLAGRNFQTEVIQFLQDCPDATDVSSASGS